MNCRRHLTSDEIHLLVYQIPYSQGELSANKNIRTNLLIKLLQCYVPSSLDAKSFNYNSYGKPTFRNENLHFNVSYSHNIIVIGVSSTHIGVDVERFDQIILSSLEQSQIQETFLLHTSMDKNQPLNIEAFYKSWTRNEALFKGIGFGFTQSNLRDNIEILTTEIFRYKNDLWYTTNQKYQNHSYISVAMKNKLKRIVLFSGNIDI